MAETILVELEKRPVTLHYPGAEGVVFEDATFVIRNEGAVQTEVIGLRMHVTQEDKVLLDGIVDLDALGVSGALDPGQEAKASFFRILQHKVAGFGSRVNLFGYKVALNWMYDVSAAPVVGPETVVASGDRTWRVCWRPSQTDANLVEVDIS